MPDDVSPAGATSTAAAPVTEEAFAELAAGPFAGMLAGGFGTPAIPELRSADEIYDQIMGPIEPELTTTTLPTLREKYKDETPEQATARVERYNRAFAEYDKRFAGYSAQMEERARRSRREARVSLEKEATAGEEATALEALESKIAGA